MVKNIYGVEHVDEQAGCVDPVTYIAQKLGVPVVLLREYLIKQPLDGSVPCFDSLLVLRFRIEPGHQSVALLAKEDL